MATTVVGKPIEECFLCYAKTLDGNRFSKTLGGATKENPISHWGHKAPRHRTSESNWKQPLAWNKKPKVCEKCGKAWGDKVGMCSCNCIEFHRPRVFCLSLGDWLDDENVPIEWLADLLWLIECTPNLDWQLLTKRPQNWKSRISEVVAYLKAAGTTAEYSFERSASAAKWVFDGEPPANVWIGVSAGADQAAALAIPARVHFLSCEPMLRPMDTTHVHRFSWAIFGGESGKKARRCSTQWIRNGVAFCNAYGVAPFVKQMGSNCTDPTGEPLRLKDSHGDDMTEWPEDLRVRCFPR